MAPPVVACTEMAVYCFDVLHTELMGEQPPPLPFPLNENISAPLFVTWKKGADHQLRGCIGTFSNLKLDTGLYDYTKASAFQDTRFRPIKKEEIPMLQCGVSLLIDFEDAMNYRDWTVGVHGVRIHFNDGHGNRSAVFLPEVMIEQEWDHLETMNQLIRKSGYSKTITENLRMSAKVVRFKSSKVVLDYKDYVAFKQRIDVPIPK